MREDRLKWNRKHLDQAIPNIPAAVVQRFASKAHKGRALDIAAGAGRNSLFLAEKGFQVEAVDISDTALRSLMPKHPNISAICADLDHFVLPKKRYDLIINLRYLNRCLFPNIKEALCLDGLLIFQTFIERPDGKHSASHNPDYLLRPNELLHAFLSLQILFYEEDRLTTEKGLGTAATLVARRVC